MNYHLAATYLAATYLAATYLTAITYLGSYHYLAATYLNIWLIGRLFNRIL